MFQRFLIFMLCLGIIAPRVTMTCCCAETVHVEGCEEAVPGCPKCKAKAAAESKRNSHQQAERRCDCRQEIESTPPFQLSNRVDYAQENGKLLAVLDVPHIENGNTKAESQREVGFPSTSCPIQCVLCIWQC